MTTLDALVARVKASGARRAYKVGAVPAEPGDAYMVLALDVGAAVNRRTTGHRSRTVHRLTVQCFGRSEAGLMDMARYADAAFDETTVTEIPGESFSVREMTVGPDPDDDGWLYVLNTYRL